MSDNEKVKNDLEKRELEKKEKARALARVKELRKSLNGIEEEREDVRRAYIENNNPLEGKL